MKRSHSWSSMLVACGWGLIALVFISLFFFLRILLKKQQKNNSTNTRDIISPPIPSPSSKTVEEHRNRKKDGHGRSKAHGLDPHGRP